MPSSTTVKKELPPLHQILIIGSGGRENALAWSLSKCPDVKEVWVAPGNAGTNQHHRCSSLEIGEENFEELLKACKEKKINLIIIGPEEPLAAGLAENFRDQGLAVFGPSTEGAKLESSKAWAKTLMNEAGIPTAKHWITNTKKEALEVLNGLQKALVVKADGLAGGKGVTVAESINATAEAIYDTFEGKYISPSEQVVLEEKLEGPEVSVFALCDGKEMVILPTAQDHKRLKDGDKGPNTGGMGAYAPTPLITPEGLENIKKTILEPTLNALKKKGIDYRGVIYAGLILTSSGPKVIEFNCRFGDPECQSLMPLLGPELAKVLQACAHGCLELAPELSTKNICSACVVAVAPGYPKSPRTNEEIKIDLQTSDNLQIFHSGTKMDKKGSFFTAGGRVLSITAQAESFEEAFNLTYKGLLEINFEGINYRRDIGHQVRNS